MSRLFSLSRAITRTKPHYRPTGTDSLGAVGDKIASVSPLSFAERYTFGSAPVNLRDAKVVEALVEWASSFARGEKVLMSRWGADKGVFSALENVEKVEAAKAAAAASPTSAPLTKRLSSSLYTPAALQSLESFHRCLTLYLWLSYRLSNIFSDQSAARTLRMKVEKAIERALEGIRFERVGRKDGARRNKARFARDEEEGSEFDELLKGFGAAAKKA
jgi:ATP-dependent RNA helicase SUPV3L1/SUV3